MAIVKQRPVGHGGFHVGCLGDDRPRFRWVYDCGAWRASDKLALELQVDDYAARLQPPGSDRIDILFLSHFDADHVNGLEKLLRRVDRPVTCLVIPYLTCEQAFFVVAEASATGADVSGLAELVSHPLDWARRHSISHVVRLRDHDTPGPAGVGAFDPFKSGPRRIDLDDDRKEAPRTSYAMFLSRGGDLIALEPDAADVPHLTDMAGQVTICVSHPIPSRADWVFVPHCDPIDHGRQARLKQRLERLYGGSDGLLEAIMDRKRRGELAAVYRELTGLGANRISLSLYCGPGGDTRESDWISSPSGWLLTGDAELERPYTFRAWEGRYREWRQHIRWLMLPHHGSLGNFCEDLVSFAPASQLFVTANSSTAGRWPHATVAAACVQELLTVSEKPSTGIVAVASLCDTACWQSDDACPQPSPIPWGEWT